MNIEEYRQMKADQETDSKEEEQPVIEEIEEEAKPEPTIEDPVDETDIPESIKIGGKEYSAKDIEDLEKGNLRTQDYTRKTQALADDRRELESAVSLMEEIRGNPEVAQQVSQMTGNKAVDPYMEHIQRLESSLMDMRVESEIDRLSVKYDDFDVQGVLELASSKKLGNLEDAYHLLSSQNKVNTPTKSEEELRAEIREQVLAEVKGQQGTKSIISRNSASSRKPKSNVPTLSTQEVSIARGMGITPKEYATWRDAKK